MPEASDSGTKGTVMVRSKASAPSGAYQRSARPRSPSSCAKPHGPSRLSQSSRIRVGRGWVPSCSLARRVIVTAPVVWTGARRVGADRHVYNDRTSGYTLPCRRIRREGCGAAVPTVRTLALRDGANEPIRPGSVAPGVARELLRRHPLPPPSLPQPGADVPQRVEEQRTGERGHRPGPRLPADGLVDPTQVRDRVPDLPPDLRGLHLHGIGGGVGIALGGEADLAGAAVGAACDDAVSGHGGLAGLDLEGDHVPDPDLLSGRGFDDHQ